jgi:hypothetical protein
MKKDIALAIVGLLLLVLGFWLGQRRAYVPFQVYDPTTRQWRDLDVKKARGKLGLFCTDGEEFFPCVDFDRSDNDSRVMLVPTNEIGPGDSISPNETE